MFRINLPPPNLAVVLLTLAVLAGSPRGWAAQPADQLLEQAQSAFAKGKPEEALSLAKKAVDAEPKNPRAHYVLGKILDTQQSDAEALAEYGRVIELDPAMAGAYQARGWVNFKLGKFNESLADFDACIKRSPASAPHLWQRGIVCYYAGKFDEGRAQFDSHQMVNPSDVENAVWHFLCNARAHGVDKARADLIRISGDRRVPMAEVYALFAGTGSEQKVIAAAQSGNVAVSELHRALFYAHLYLGLYFEALGDAKKAREHMEKAAKDFRENQAMGDVARVHLQVLNRKKTP